MAAALRDPCRRATAARRGQRVDLRLTQRVRATQTGSRPRAAAILAQAQPLYAES